MSAFRLANLPIVAGSAVVVVTVMLVVLSTAAAGAAGGTLISRLVNGDRARRALSVGLAALLAASVVDLWI